MAGARPWLHRLAAISAATIALPASIVGLSACGASDDTPPATTAARNAADAGDWKEVPLPATLRRGQWWGVCAVTSSGNGVTLDAWYRPMQQGGSARYQRIATPRCSTGSYVVVKPEAKPGTASVELSGGGIDAVKIVGYEPGTDPWLRPSAARAAAGAATGSPIPGVPRLRTRSELDAWVAQKSDPDVRPVVFFCNRAPEDICRYYNQFPTWFLTVMDGRGLGDEMRARTAYVNTMDVPDWPYRGVVTVEGLATVRYRGGDDIGRFTIMSGTSWQTACRALLTAYDTRLPDSACPGTPPTR